MPRPLWPPRYVNSPLAVLLNDEISNAAYRFYNKLRALAWGDASLAMPMSKLVDAVKLNRSQVYEYARSLRDHRGLLSYAVRNDVFECSFADPVQNPENPDLLTLSFSSSQNNEEIPPRARRKSGKSGFPEKAGKSSKADPRTQHGAIQACRAVVGRYPPKEIYDDLITALGAAPDLERLKNCRKEWVKRYNPNAWTWALEWYGGGLPAHITKKPAEPASTGAGPWRRGSS